MKKIALAVVGVFVIALAVAIAKRLPPDVMLMLATSAVWVIVCIVVMAFFGCMCYIAGRDAARPQQPPQQTYNDNRDYSRHLTISGVPRQPAQPGAGWQQVGRGQPAQLTRGGRR